MGRGRWRFLRDDRGQSLVEIGLAAPILVFALIGGIDLLRVSALQQATVNAARVAAEYVSADPTVCDTGTSPANRMPAGCNVAARSVRQVIDAELGNTPGYTASGAAVPSIPFERDSNLQIMGRYPDGPGGSLGTPWCSTSRTVVSGDGPARQLCFVAVRVTYTFRTLVPWLFVPNQVTSDRTVVRALYR